MSEVHRRGWLGLVLALVMWPGSAPGLDAEAAEAVPSADVARFGHFVAALAPLCATGPATACVDLAFGVTDRDDDGDLSLKELEAQRAGLEAWSAARADALAVPERNAIQLGLWVVDMAGLEALFRSYDQDGDGGLSQAELTADISLDERPLGEIVQDRGAVDWARVGQRLGPLSSLLERFGLGGAPDGGS